MVGRAKINKRLKKRKCSEHGSMEHKSEGVRKAVNWPEESTDERCTGETTSLGSKEGQERPC